MKNSDDCTYYTPMEIASMLKMGRDRAYGLFHRSDFPGVKIGHNYIVSKTSFDAWFTSQQGKDAQLKQ